MLHHVGGQEIGRIRHQQQLAVHQSGLGQRTLVDTVVEEFALEVYAHYARHVVLEHRVTRAHGGAAIAQLADTP